MTPIEKIKASIDSLKKTFEDATKKTEMEKFFEVKTSDDKIITVDDVDGDGVPTSGDACTMDGAPVADGDYQIMDGTIITVVGGVITNVTTAEIPTEEDKIEEVINSAIAKAVTELKADFEAKLKDSTDANALLAETLEANKIELANQRKLIESTFEVVQLLSDLPTTTASPDPTEKEKMASQIKLKKQTALEKLIADRQAIKN